MPYRYDPKHWRDRAAHMRLLAAAGSFAMFDAMRLTAFAA